MFLEMLGIKAGAAGSGSKYDQCAMLPKLNTIV